MQTPPCRLAKTIAAALVATAPGAGAVHLDPRGIGQALVFPYYTVNSGNQTLISVVNQTDAGKAIGVRFREGRNARETRQFNLYLAPFDTWTASVFSRSDSDATGSANLVTADASCTVPAIRTSSHLPMVGNHRYVPFSNFHYTGTDNDAGPNGLERSREGYFELIEMGEVTNAARGSLAAITRGSSGSPANCLQIEQAWLDPTLVGQVGYWFADSSVDIAPPRGGLFGSAAIVDALAGTMMTYTASAIDGFSDVAHHTQPGNEDALALHHVRTNATSAAAHTFAGGAAVTSVYPTERAIDAVSALFAQDAIFNEFVTHPALGGRSEWVVTLPTKYAYTDEAIVGATPLPPFPRLFPRAPASQHAGNTGTAAVDLAVRWIDREGYAHFICEPPECLPFPGLPPPGPPVLQWSWASNVMTFNQPQSPTDGSAILGSRLAIDVNTLDDGMYDGWARVLLHRTGGEPPLRDQRMRPDLAGGVWNGLPVIGFLAVSYTNGQLTPGVLSNYAGAYPHRGAARYESPPP
jgi:hypothetical protein